MVLVVSGVWACLPDEAVGVGSDCHGVCMPDRAVGRSWSEIRCLVKSNSCSEPPRTDQADCPAKYGVPGLQNEAGPILGGTRQRRPRDALPEGKDVQAMRRIHPRH